jgi:excisionase family DNA binding protein
MEDRLINIDEAVAYLGRKKSTIRAWCSQKKIPFIKLGEKCVMFDPVVLRDWVRGKLVMPRVSHGLEG